MARPFLLRTRWLIGHVVILAMIVLMVNLGIWQVHRLGERKDLNAATKTALQATPLTGIPPADTAAYRAVQLSGTWSPTGSSLIRYFIRDGVQGYELVTPLVLADGTSIDVVRGWIPLDIGKVVTAAQAAPPGPVTIDGWYRKAETRDPKAGVNEASPPMPTQEALDRPAVQVRTDADTGTFTVDGVPVTPKALDGPDLSEGPHFSYALQWFSFCLIAAGGWGILLWKTRRDEIQEAAEQLEVTPA